MTMKNLFWVLLSFILLANTNCEQKKKHPKKESSPVVTQDVSLKKETIHFKAADGLSITADYYPVAAQDAPLILLFHQAGYSRGEYLEIAPKLNKLGYQCLAVDQRSGKEVNGVTNETHQEAVKKGLETEYVNAIPDLEGALAYAKNELHAKKVIAWGSSYSAALMFYFASKHPEEVKAILTFSPGAYFEINDHPIKSFASEVSCPVFVTSAKNEQDRWQDIYDAVPSEKYFFLPEVSGKHGSKALWAKHEGQEAYWQAVEAFLGKL